MLRHVSGLNRSRETPLPACSPYAPATASTTSSRFTMREILRHPPHRRIDAAISAAAMRYSCGPRGGTSMDLLQLEHFLAVVEERTFTRAAERVCRTQPAVSQIGRGGRRADSVRDQARHERRRDGKHRLDNVRPD